METANNRTRKHGKDLSKDFHDKPVASNQHKEKT